LEEEDEIDIEDEEGEKEDVRGEQAQALQEAVSTMERMSDTRSDRQSIASQLPSPNERAWQHSAVSSNLSPSAYSADDSATPVTSPHPRSSDQRFSMKSEYTDTSAKSTGSKLEQANLLDDSVLSVSETDAEEAAETDNEDSYSTLPAVRDSIAVSEYDANILIGRARAFEVNPRLLPNQPSQLGHRHQPSDTSTVFSTATADTEERGSSVASSSFLTVLPQPKTSMRRQLSGKPSSIPEHSEQNRSANAPVARRKPAPLTLFPIQPKKASNTQVQALMAIERHKLMAVTEEEEALLEMMRRKRAAMAKHSFTTGYETALKLKDVAGRKRTPSTQEAARIVSQTVHIPADFNEMMNAFPASPTSTHTKRRSVINEMTPRGHNESPAPTNSSSSRSRSDVRDSTVSTTHAVRSESPLDAFSRRSNRDGVALAPSKTYRPLTLEPLDTTISPMFMPNATTAGRASSASASANEPSRDASPATPLQRGDEDVVVKVAGSTDVSRSGSGSSSAFDTTRVDETGTRGLYDDEEVFTARSPKQHRPRQVTIKPVMGRRARTHSDAATEESVILMLDGRSAGDDGEDSSYKVSVHCAGVEHG